MSRFKSRVRLWPLFAGLLIVIGFLLYRSTLPTRYTGFSRSEPWTPLILSDSSTLYLPDYSFAGYEWGETELPELKPTLWITEFGAIPDDGIDDTGAILSALEAAHSDTSNVIIGFPAGRFIVRDILFIERSNIVLQGAGSGPDGTTLFAPLHLNAIANEKATNSLGELQQYLIENNLKNLGRPFSLYAWSGGMIWTRNPASAKEVLTAAHSGKRGQHRFTVDDASALNPGDVLELTWYNSEGRDSSLLDHVLGEYRLPIGERLFDSPNKPLLVQPFTIESVDGNSITIKEPLLHDVRAEWGCLIRTSRFLDHIGIEHLAIVFPESEYAGHHLDEGYNGIYLSDVQHSWVRDVRVRHSDTAILTTRSKNITVQSITITGRKGHHSIYVSNTFGFLTKRFLIESDAFHNPSFNTGSTLSVFTDGYISNAVLDQHSGLNQQNLYDNIRTGNTRHLMDHGGAPYWRPTAGRFNTFWNIVAEDGDDYTGITRNAPEARIIGLIGPEKSLSIRYGPGLYIEGLNRRGIQVPSLYEYQLKERLKN